MPPTPPRIFAQEIITPSIPLHHLNPGWVCSSVTPNGKERFALAGSTRATIGIPCKSIPLLRFVRLQKKKKKKIHASCSRLAKGKFLFDVLEKIRLEIRIFKKIIFLRYLWRYFFGYMSFFFFFSNRSFEIYICSISISVF